MDYKTFIIVTMTTFSISAMTKSYNSSLPHCPFKNAIAELTAACKDYPPAFTDLTKIKKIKSNDLLSDEETLSFVTKVRNEPVSYTSPFDSPNNSLENLAQTSSPLHTEFLYLYKEENSKRRMLLLKAFILFRILYPDDKNIGILIPGTTTKKLSHYCILF